MGAPGTGNEGLGLRPSPFSPGLSADPAEAASGRIRQSDDHLHHRLPGRALPQGKGLWNEALPGKSDFNSQICLAGLSSGTVGAVPQPGLSKNYPNPCLYASV